MASDRSAALIRICTLCQLIHDDGEPAYERWITRDVYKKANGVDPTKSRLTYTYCPDCSSESKNPSKAA